MNTGAGAKAPPIGKTHDDRAMNEFVVPAKWRESRSQTRRIFKKTSDDGVRRLARVTRLIPDGCACVAVAAQAGPSPPMRMNGNTSPRVVAHGFQWRTMAPHASARARR